MDYDYYGDDMDYQDRRELREFMAEKREYERLEEEKRLAELFEGCTQEEIDEYWMGKAEQAAERRIGC